MPAALKLHDASARTHLVVFSVMTLAAIAAIWALAVNDMQLKRQDALDERSNQARQMAIFFERHVLNTIRYGDSYLKAIRRQFERSYDIESARTLMREVPLNQVIASHLTILDTTGKPVYIDGYPIKPDSTAADRPYFLTLKGSNADQLVISLPHKGRNTGRVTVRLARQVRAPDGAFAGVIFVALEAEEITSFFRAMKLGPKSSATLVGTDKRIRARSSYGKLGPGQDISGSRIWRELANNRTGLYEQTSVVDGVTRVYAYRQLADHPLVVAIGVSVDDAKDAAWLHQRRDYGIAVLSTLLLLVFIGVLIREQRIARSLRVAFEKAESEIQMRLQVEHQLRRREQELVRSNEELENFAYLASHDLQEPLRKVVTFGDRLKQRYAQVLDARGLDYLSRMRQASTRMSSLIRDLLAFSRMSTAEVPHHEVNLQGVFDEAIKDLELQLNEADAEVKCGPLPAVVAAEIHMRQLAHNLLSNAVKYRDPKRPLTVEIVGSLRDESDGDRVVELRVADNGIGFEPQYAERIFGVFERLHGDSQYPGTGIGLALVRKIAERHGGTATAESKPGVGTTFIITLRADGPEAAPVTSAQA